MAASPDYILAVHPRLTAGQAAAVASLLDRVTEHDGMQPLSEHVWLHLKDGGDESGTHIIATLPDSPGPVGYAHLDATDVVDGPSAELTVDPSVRRMGLGRLLVQALVDLVPDGRLRLWAHGEQTGAADLAVSMGFTRSRVLWQMRRSLLAPLPRPAIPDGIEVRPFRPGVDNAAWLAVNAVAFADLPDQGGWQLEDLERRLREPWFSADGFLTAWQGHRLVGFHWTKVHGLAPGHTHGTVGEVYIVGVDPGIRARGLGRALTVAGLRHLRSLGLAQAMLYVDASNTAAIRLYEGLGFARWDSDVQFRRLATGSAALA